MAETIGLAIISAAGLAEVSGIAGLGTLGATTIGGTSIATIVGTTAIIGASIGLQYALANTETPKVEAGAIALKQAIPSRQRGYWINRLAGNYMYYEAHGPGPNASHDVVAFHHGRITEVLQCYLHDDAIATVPDPTHEVGVFVQATGDGWYSDNSVLLAFNFGLPSQTAFGGMAGWTVNHRGNGVASATMQCQAPPDPSLFTTIFPHGEPKLSAVVKCSPIWDPRDPAQDPDDEETWIPSPNPVLQLLDYLIRPGIDGGMGHDRDILFPPARLAQWMEEADLCDGLNGGLPRYRSAGWYKFDNKPEDIFNKMLAACDGYTGEDGEGTFELTVGVYREPSEPPITDAHIVGWSINHGIADEQLVNQLDVSFTNPALGYVSDQIDSVRDEDSISLTGYVRAQPLDLSWVQDPDQAELLGQRALLRLNPAKSGSIVTTLYGFRWYGKRWVKLQFSAVNGLEDCVIEIQSASVNIMSGRITFNFNTVDVAAFEDLEPPYRNLDFSKTNSNQFLVLLEDI